MKRLRKVKILATLGPASSEEDMIEKLHEAGADLFRINMSHSSHELMRTLVKRIRAAKDHGARTQSELRRSNERVQALSEHIEKLMVHLKHEAAAKARQLEVLKWARAEADRTDEDLALLRQQESSAQHEAAAVGGEQRRSCLALTSEQCAHLHYAHSWRGDVAEHI